MSETEGVCKSEEEIEQFLKDSSIVVAYITNRYNPNLYDEAVIQKRLEWKRFDFQSEFNQRITFGV